MYYVILLLQHTPSHGAIQCMLKCQSYTRHDTKLATLAVSGNRARQQATSRSLHARTPLAPRPEAPTLTHQAIYSAGLPQYVPGLLGCRQPVWGVSWGGGGGGRPAGAKCCSVRYRNMLTTLDMPPCSRTSKERLITGVHVCHVCHTTHLPTGVRSYARVVYSRNTTRNTPSKLYNSLACFQINVPLPAQLCISSVVGRAQ